MGITHQQIREIKSAVSDICKRMGLNRASSYKGVETIEDILLHLKAIKYNLPRKGLTDSYAVYREEGKKVCPHYSSELIAFLFNGKAEERRCYDCQEVFIKRL